MLVQVQEKPIIQENYPLERKHTVTVKKNAFGQFTAF